MDYKAEKITPYGNGDSKTEQVRDMFDAIAPAYDFMNRAMTFGIDRIWRRIAVGMIRKYRPSSVLDVATGTGDLAFFENADKKIIHVGILLDSNRIMHCSGRVKINQIDSQGIISEETGQYTHQLRVIKRIFGE